MKITFSVAAFAALLACGPAQAHVVLEKDQAAPRSGFKAVFKMTHGCKGSPTTAVRVAIPEGIIGAKPMPKAGWTLEIEKGPYKRAYPFYHGTIDKGATAITWKGGSLPDDVYDEFVVSAFVSDAFAPGDTIFFPIMQTCTEGEQRWVEVPAKGQDAHALAFPAPKLTITAPDGGAAPAAYRRH